jgi:hypothetical protein
MSGNNNAWSGSTADRRLFRAVAPDLTSVLPGLQNNPWLAAVASTTAIAADPGGGTTLLVQFIARDGFSVAETSYPVEIVVTGGRINTANAVANSGTVVTQGAFSAPLNDAANTGVSVTVLPHDGTTLAAGLVAVLFTFNAGATAKVFIRHRHITAWASVTVA